MEWSFEPGVIAWLLTVEVLYVRAVRILRRRGADVPRGQVACWHAGIALQALGLLGPTGAHDAELLTAHMAEHILLADLAAPLLVAGLRTPVLQFFLPRPALVAFARRARLRAVLGKARRPLAAVALYVTVLYGWHVAPLFEAATRSPAVHALQHASFVATGILVWWALLEPQRRRMPGELWKILQILGARLPAMAIGMAFVLARAPLYTGVYDAEERPFGFSALADQQTAGAMMMSVDILIMVGALGFFFWRAAQDDARREEAERDLRASPAPTGR
jgi:putative membrane protein